MERNARLMADHFVRRWENAWNSGGPAAVADLYTADAVLVFDVLAREFFGRLSFGNSFKNFGKLAVHLDINVRQCHIQLRV